MENTETTKDEGNGWRKMLQIALDKNKAIKILFLYPGSTKVVVKRGFVRAVFPDCFSIDEVKDGYSTHSYAYISEITQINIKDGLHDVNSSDGRNSHNFRRRP